SCSTKLRPETFLAFHICGVEKLTKDTYLVRFILPANSQLGLHPGQHLVLRGVVDGLEIQRAYTPISPATAEGYFDVLIKCYQTGLMSRYVESWRTGDMAFWRGPFGGFLYEPNKETSPELLPWSYREKTYFGRLGQELVDELVSRCRRKPFALVCGSPEFTKDMARCLLSAGLMEDSFFLF
uniref:NADH-cytochrome b5 reductase-like n=1 Tax=Nannospalax galili TaxID=1026970 RepID=A0A8C6S0P1_NANGA